MKGKFINFVTSITLTFLYCIFSLEKSTLTVLKFYFPFYFDFCLLEMLDWVEYNLNLWVYWILFIVIMSLCVRNRYGEDIETPHYIIFSAAMGYCIYLHKQFYPRDTLFLLIKIFIVWAIVIGKVFWSVLYYSWFFDDSWPISMEGLKNLSYFIWIKDHGWKKPKGVIFFTKIWKKFTEIWKTK